jgi:hypothetical protein
MMALRWFAAALGGVILYVIGAGLLSADLHQHADLVHHVDYTVGAQLPWRVAYQADDGWKLVLLVWALAAWLGFCGFRLAAALRQAHETRLAPVAAGFAILALVLTFTPVTFSGDPYAYVIYGNLYGLHGINPYLLFAPLQTFNDPILERSLSFYGNPPPADNYGPLWTLLCGVLARVETGASLGVQVWTYRALAAASIVLAVMGLFKIIAKSAREEAVSRAACFAFQPLVLYESAVGGHNDAPMVAFAVWAFALVDDFPLFAGLLIGASIAIKFVSLIALPFLVVRAARKSPLSGALLAVVALLIFALCFRPFWAGEATLLELIRHGGVLAMSPTWLASEPFFAQGLGNTPAFGQAISLPLLGQPSWPRVIQLVLFAGFLAVIAVAVIRYARSRSLTELWRSVTSFLWASPIVQPWYLMWLSPAVAYRGAWSVFAWWFLTLAFLRYALDGWSGTPLWLLVILTFVIFVAPIGLARQKTGAHSRSAGPLPIS